MGEFWGRRADMAALGSELAEVRRTGQGRMVAIRGRRQSGKSRLVIEFVEDAEVPYLFTTAVKNAGPAVQLETVMEDLAVSRTPLPHNAVAFAAPASSWTDLFARLPLAIGDHEAVVVLDEFPWAVETDDTLEGVLQNAWDRTLERLPILVILVGSDMATMCP
ncbi:MAG: ATP-binding protein [Microthrixaceae bacterium]